MMKGRFLLILGLVLAAILLSGGSVYAAQASRTLQPGYTYEFQGLDPRVITHVNIPANNRYEFVEINAQGEIVGFGISNWRVSISGEGRTLVTPLTPLRVTFDSSRLRLTVTEGSVLHRSNVPYGTSTRISNTGFATLNVRMNQTTPYDFIITNRLNNVENYGSMSRFPQLGIPGGGSLLVHAPEDNITIYFPSWWFNDVLEVERVDHPALVRLFIEADSVNAFRNLSGEALVLTAEPEYEGIDFMFEYVIRGRDGHVISHGDDTSDTIRINPSETLLLIPLINANVVFPYTLADYVELEIGEEAPIFHPLEPGQSISITNNDDVRTHTVFVSCSQNSGVFSFDHVLVDGEDVSFQIHENVTIARASISIPPGGVLSITATYAERNLEISLPELDEITYTPFNWPVVTRQVLRPGSSVLVSNSGDVSIDILPASPENRANLDFVILAVEDGEVEDFGQVTANSLFEIRPGEAVHFTSPDYTVTLHIPRIFLDNGVSRESVREQALNRTLLTGNDVLLIENRDRRYNHTFLTIDAGARQVRQASYAYEFVLESRNGDVVAYGMNQFGFNILPHNHRMTIMSGANREVLVAFPAKWYGSIFGISNPSEAPLYRLTLAPGRTLVIENPNRETFILANNSHDTAAGFYMRGPGHNVRRYRQVQLPGRVITPDEFFPPDWVWAIPSLRNLAPLQIPGQVTWQPYYVYVPSAPPRPGRDAPDEGDLQIPARTNVRITAAPGDDLEIWMPTEWARKLGLK